MFVYLPRTPEIPVSLAQTEVFSSPPGRLKPFMLRNASVIAKEISRKGTHRGSCMIESNIKNDLQTTPVNLLNQELKVLHSSKHRVDLAIVANIIPVVLEPLTPNIRVKTSQENTYPMSHIGDS